MSDKWVALLRGVNVGGANKVPMAELRALAEGLGWTDVKSYIASGNLVFEANAGDLVGQLRSAMIAQMGVYVAVRVLPAQEILDAENACPWDVKGNLVHAFFCLEAPVLDETLRDTLITEDEELVIQGKRVWLFAPSGVARSKLMAKMERVLGVQATARNLNTVRKLAQMVR
ncbi:Uncharacterized conserved protein, DUF1697 family [Octadecabacter temperatus]|uniref:Uncharacterized protein n=2 Tax=Octadecabacter temperatus TaxID=1458307 RepID=A0A0K0Y5D0_9RHOB|nr:hypothetical protein OSB_16250 [Octadecabacter temperatus]SIO08991.1 Uncharacterized conserved protein, DUF1697 family [Octadecabacter temperatus]